MKTLLLAVLAWVVWPACHAQALPHTVDAHSLSTALPPSAHPDTVWVGVYIYWLNDLDLPAQEFSTNFFLWANYKSDTLDPLRDLMVTNAKSYTWSHQRVRRQHGRNWATAIGDAVVKQRWRVENFPFDEQEMHIRLGYMNAKAEQVLIMADTAGSTYDLYNHEPGWRFKQFQVSAKPRVFASDFGEPGAKASQTAFARFDAKVVIQREGGTLFIKLFTGMYVAFLISWLAFNIPPTDVDPRFGLSVGGLFASVGNKYIVDNIVPSIVSTTLSDKLHAVTFGAVLATVLMSVISLYLARRRKDGLHRRIDRIASLVLLVVFIIINAVIIRGAIWG